MPKISVIMPCRNGAEHLSRSLGSVLGQTLGDWELIFVDDGSTDGSADIARSFADKRIRVLQHRPAGVSAARNAGIARATGQYLAFLDADDRWHPGFLQKMFSVLESEEGAVLSYCGWQNVGLEGARGQPFIPPDYEGPDKEVELFRGCRWPIHAALVRKQSVIDAGGFDPQYSNAEDYALWLRVATRGRIVRVPEVLAFYQFHSVTQASANTSNSALQLWKAQQEYLKIHSEFRHRLGKQRRLLTRGELLRRGYECYWRRDLRGARTIFRKVMRVGYGSLRDWKYMLPSLLPFSVHQFLVGKFERKSREKSGVDVP